MRQISIDTDMFVLGFGEFSYILKGKFDGQEVAVKSVPLEHHDLNEEEAMLNLDHPNIVKLFHCESDDNFRYYALELCVASLDHLFLKTDDHKKYNGPMPRHIEVFQHLALGLEHIHSKDLVHGDIRPENVLISVGSAGPDEITIKWADFGLNRNVDVQGTEIKGEAGGKNAWLAPELLKLIGTKNHGTAKGDVFAQGLVFGTLFLNGEHLYGSMKNGNEILDNIIKGDPINMQKIDGKLRDCYENDLIDLLKKMLENDPDKRMTSTQVVNQLKAIKIAGKEKELLELCGRDSRLDLTGKIQNLIQFGINVNAKDYDGRNALHLLCRNYSSPTLTDAIKLVIQSGIDVDARDKDGLNAIHYLCRYHSSQNLIIAIQILTHYGIDAKATTNDGSNALHYLCRYNSNPNLIDAMKILTHFGLDLMTEDNSGWSAFYYLKNKDKKEMKIWFDRDALLGMGGFGAVCKGKFGGREVAVKRVQLHHVSKREEEAMLKLDHPNIVKLFHFESDDDFRYYAMELCDASLNRLFLHSADPRKYNGPMPRHIEAFQQLASGLEHIHSKNLAYRDIKPSDILISATSARQPIEVTLKWCDFGLAKSVNEKGLYSWSGVRGTRTWYAPEVLKKLILEKAEEEEFWGTVKSQKVAVKRVEFYLVNKNEQIAMENLNHPNIIKLLHSEFNKDFTYYALELCDASLDQLFLQSSHPKKYKGPMPRRIEVFLQLASGLEYIHSKGFTHRDIKPGNILISVGHEDHKEEVTIKWADFGLSRPVNERGTFTPSRITGTKTWLAAEIVRRYRKGEECRGDVKSDVFALALVFGWLFLYGKNLYGSNEFEIENNIIERRPINMQSNSPFSTIIYSFLRTRNSLFYFRN
ncbi:hypothetical protein GHT06_021105 [Daphnia sinensis]|uniref:Protein kinase domain-containing protein n=1 Tax=Daphnia sinensis TaxID=1820382 RepID=A0AAD5KZ24_9CRUS|nr:hypothetical protein GHT06_021105 [Daphnia sinensis]